jgi:hypothetical protein
MHHLAGVGHLLGSVIQSPLSQWTYLQVRNVLLAMVDLLASLEANTSTEGGSARLKAHIQRIDAYMTNAAREKQGKEVYHSALPKEAWSNEQSLRSTVSEFDTMNRKFADDQYDIYTAGTMTSKSEQREVRPDHGDVDPALSSEPINLASFNQIGSSSMDSSSFDQVYDQSNQGSSSNWLQQQDISPNQQVQLPESFFTDWPFNMGQGEAFDFLGDFQSQNQSQTNGASLPGQQEQENGTGGIQDILGVGMPEGFVGAGQIGGVLGSMGFTDGNGNSGL